VFANVSILEAEHVTIAARPRESNRGTGRRALTGPRSSTMRRGFQLNPLAFWDGLTAHEFKLCPCTRCGRWYFPYTICNRHEAIPEFHEMVWVPASGLGTIFAKLVVHQVRDPDFASEVPYALAMVELED
jgi:uncharacterized OB-fold protein